MTNQKKKYIKERYVHKFGKKDFLKHLREFEAIKPFSPSGNIFDNQDVNEKTHFIMRTAVQYNLTEAFKDMKIDLTDPNVSECLTEGNIGTAGRIAKVWTGSSINDDRELGGGRWSKKPRLAAFPNESGIKLPITKRIDIISNCSHHFIPFSTITREDSYAIISYVPENKVIGISKLQRVADWVSQRFFLQEDLTRMLYEEVSKVAETSSVYVGLYNMSHGCESFRGAKAKDGAFTSEYYNGAFNDIELRNSIK